MLFSSPTFLFLFLPVFLAVYGALVPLRRPVLLAASLLFYAWSEPIFLGVVLASSGLDYFLGARLVRLPAGSPARIWLVRLGVIANVGILIGVKYSGFMVENANVLRGALGGGAWTVPRLALPLGISFIIFEKITYVVDLNRRAAPPARSFFDYLSYVFLFPKLLAGPIVKYRDLAGQIARPSTPSFEQVRDGLLRFVQGLSKKVLLADPLASYVDPVFALTTDRIGLGTAWLAIGAFTLQLYFDFSGYSDMAIGLGRVLGFRLRENFHDPFIAPTAPDFWRRWHISLGSWVRQYIYVPLGGQRRVSPFRGFINLGICMVIIGLWHGASWNFVIWGCGHWLFMAADQSFLWRVRRYLPRWFNIAWTIWMLVPLQVFFRSGTLRYALGYYGVMFGLGTAHPEPVILYPDVLVLYLIGTFLIFAPYFGIHSILAPRLEAAATHRTWALLLGLVLLTCDLCRVAVSTFHPFLYFHF